MVQKLYTSGEYLKRNPLWHTDESPWKVKYVLKLLTKNKIAPQTICEVGCGAGEVLRLIQTGVDGDCTYWGYEISPQAFELCRQRANERLHFKLADIRQEGGIHFDLLLLVDVLEHVEDPFSFLRDIRPKSTYKIIHLPLDISVRNVLLGNLIKFRAAYGHLHYFTKDLALQMLRDAGYEVIDYLYTWQENPLQFTWSENRKSPRKIARKLAGFIARKILGVPSLLFFALQKDLAARVIGRWRLMILAK